MPKNFLCEDSAPSAFLHEKNYSAEYRSKGVFLLSHRNTQRYTEIYYAPRLLYSVDKKSAGCPQHLTIRKADKHGDLAQFGEVLTFFSTKHFLRMLCCSLS